MTTEAAVRVGVVGAGGRGGSFQRVRAPLCLAHAHALSLSLFTGVRRPLPCLSLTQKIITPLPGTGVHAPPPPRLTYSRLRLLSSCLPQALHALGATVQAVCDIDPSKAASAKDLLGAAHAFTDYERMLTEGGCE